MLHYYYIAELTIVFAELTHPRSQCLSNSSLSKELNEKELQMKEIPNTEEIIELKNM